MVFSMYLGFIIPRDIDLVQQTSLAFNKIKSPEGKLEVVKIGTHRKSPL